MRNFSQISQVNFLSYIVNDEFYREVEHVGMIVGALAAAFETAPSLVIKSWNEEILYGSESSQYLSPSEYGVLIQLFEFWGYVRSSFDERGKFESRVFSYFNLNTGRSVIWCHTIG
jgi:hypothetical protein